MLVRAPASAQAPAQNPTHPAGRRLTRAGLFLGGALLLVVAVGLRFRQVGEVWLDEAQSVAIARLPVRGGLVAALRNDGAPPLYYLLLHGWIGLFGSGTAAVRTFSGVLSVATLPLAWLAGRRIGGHRWTGWATLGLTASSPWALRYATETRMYTMVTLLVFAGVLALDAVRRQPGALRVAGLAVVCAALLLTHYWSIFLLVTAGAGLAGYALLRRSRWAAASLGGMVAGALLCLPWLPVFRYQLAYTGTPWAPRATLLDLARTPAHWAGGNLTLALLTSVILTMAVIASSSLGARMRLRDAPLAVHWLAAVAGVTLLLAWIAAVAGIGAYRDRYTAVAVPLALLVTALGAATLPRRVGSGVLAVVAVLGLAVSYGQSGVPRTQADQVAATIRERAASADVVAFCPDQLAPAVSRILDRSGRPGPRIILLPAGQNPSLIDWTNYQQRITATDPTAFARDLNRVAGTSGTVFLVRRGFDSPTFSAVCGAVASELDRIRGASTLLVRDAGSVYEDMRLFSWRAPPGPST